MTKKYICKLDFYKIITFLLFTIFIFFSCEIEKETPRKLQPINLEPNDSLGTDKPTIIGPVVDSIQLLDLKSINFKPSNKALSFASIAVGDIITGDNSRNKISLTNSGWTHPSVLYFETAWNNYHYWMAITPYPNSDSQYENPHIFCSNNGVAWIEPVGVDNPIESSPLGSAYNSDVNLMFKDGYLYCYWRSSGVMVNGLPCRGIFVKKSLNGISWSPKEIVGNWPPTGIDVIAPSIVNVKKEHNYYCYGVCTGESNPGSYFTQYSIRRTVSQNEFNFIIDRKKGYELINIEGRPWGDKQEPWHTDVQKIGNIWLMLVTTTDNGQYGAHGSLFLGYSLDGINFSFNDKPICNVNGTYKSGFVPIYDRQNKIIKIQLWRTSVANNWQVFFDEFFINIK